MPRPGRPRKAEQEARKKAKRQPIFGRRLMRLLEKQLARLAKAPTHGNRKLGYDHPPRHHTPTSQANPGQYC